MADGIRVQEFTIEGRYLRSLGSKGTGTGQLESPVGVAIDAHHHVCVADYSNNRVVEFDEEGGFVRQFGSPGAGNGQFKHPIAVALDQDKARGPAHDRFG